MSPTCLQLQLYHVRKSDKFINGTTVGDLYGYSSTSNSNKYGHAGCPDTGPAYLI